MESWIVEHEKTLRLGVFLSFLLGLMLAEALWPRRQRLMARWRRWLSNLALVFVNTLLLRLALPLLAVGTATVAQDSGWGIFNLLNLPTWVTFTLSLILLDFAIYWQHVVFHAVPVLWRLHRVHHADVDFDVTTGSRFHPIEIIVSMLIKMGLIVALGVSPVAVIVFEVVLNACALFNHSNLKLPIGLDRWLRLAVVTPDMHRVHHSTLSTETNSNFGFNLSVWDRFFKTYRAQPQAGHEQMKIGLNEFKNPKLACDLPGLLVLPFVGKSTHNRIFKAP
jgi:sterol desaturase/sphingolipid hydroxylase (fatty acid hydroxylase superfamily)